MRRHLTAAILVILGAGAAVTMAALQPEQRPDGQGAVTALFRIEGMTCGGCEVGVEFQVKKLDGVQRVEASYEEGQAEVTYDPTEVTPDQIVAAIERLGYEAQLASPASPDSSGAEKAPPP